MKTELLFKVGDFVCVDFYSYRRYGYIRELKPNFIFHKHYYHVDFIDGEDTTEFDLLKVHNPNNISLAPDPKLLNLI
jgi:hypothetical protein